MNVRYAAILPDGSRKPLACLRPADLEEIVVIT